MARAAGLASRGEPFVLATVVRRTAPSSARPGWRALVEGDGTLHGWLGGSCIEPTVRREAVRVLRDGRPRYLIFSPESDDAAVGGSSSSGGTGRGSSGGRGPDTVVYPMVCHSGGTVEIFVEPQLPTPVLALFGDSPVSRALAAMGPAAGYSVVVVGAGEAAAAYADLQTVETVETLELAKPSRSGESPQIPEKREAYAVVATMGEWDEDATRQALASGARYVGLVSSPRRAESIRRTLAERGMDEGSLERLVSPAGLDLGAVEPSEIAITILAELVQRRRRGQAQRDPDRISDEERSDRRATAAEEELRTEWRSVTTEEASNAAAAEESETPAPEDTEGGLATDPVCGMAVDVDTARHVHSQEGRRYYFCCPHCLERFAAEPESFLT